MKPFCEDAFENGIPPLGPFCEVQVYAKLKTGDELAGVIYGTDAKEAISLCDLGGWLVLSIEHGGIVLVDKGELRQVYFKEKARNVFIKADNVWSLFVTRENQ